MGRRGFGGLGVSEWLAFLNFAVFLEVLDLVGE